jgi:hypothetical protein
MENYTLEEALDYVNATLCEAYESAIPSEEQEEVTDLDTVIESITEAYDDGIISYEQALDYLEILDTVTESRRMDREIDKKADEIEMYNKMADHANDKGLVKTANKFTQKRNRVNLSGKRTKLDNLDIKRYANSVGKERGQIKRDWYGKPAETKEPGKYLKLQNELNDIKKNSSKKRYHGYASKRPEDFY